MAIRLCRGKVSKMEYMIVCNSAATEQVSEVNSYMKLGWYPVGGLSVSNEGTDRDGFIRTYFYQAVMRNGESVTKMDTLPNQEGFYWVRRAGYIGWWLAYYRPVDKKCGIAISYTWQTPQTVGDKGGLSCEYYDDVRAWRELKEPE